MVTSQKKLMEHLGIDHVVAVIGPSMGGMQTLQWGVSYPDFMDSLVALVPLARTPAWTVTVLEATRKAIMLDPAWKNGDYDAPPEQGIRLWRDILNFLAARSPEMSRDQFDRPLDMLPYLQAQETALIKAFDANDWIYQTWAYDQHDVGTTPGFNGDTVKALRAIKAKTLVLVGTKDLLNPEWEPTDAARYIKRRARGDHQSRLGHRPCLCGWRPAGGHRLPQRAGVRLPRPRHPERQEAGLRSGERCRVAPSPRPPGIYGILHVVHRIGLSFRRIDAIFETGEIGMRR